MAVSKIRSSNQLMVDADFDMSSHKGINMLDGVAASDSVTVGQMTTAIGNAIAGVGNSIHAPVQDLAASKAIAGAGREPRGALLVG